MARRSFAYSSALVLAAVFAVVVASSSLTTQAFECGSRQQQGMEAACDKSFQKPSAECCNRLKAFRELAKTKEERIQLCRCVQERSSRYRNGVSPVTRIPKIDALPAKCGLPFIYSADRKFNCNTVN